jgi:hypothetical protein
MLLFIAKITCANSWSIQADKLNIALLANSCPVAVGNCVYKARSLYALINPGMQYNDDMLCGAALPPNKKGSNPYTEEEEFLNTGGTSGSILNSLENIDFLLYPNPNTQGGQLTIAYHLPSSIIGEIRIYDMVGRDIDKVFLSSNANRVVFELPQNLACGTYKVCLFQGNKLIRTKKLSLVR